MSLKTASCATTTSISATAQTAIMVRSMPEFPASLGNCYKAKSSELTKKYNP